MVVTEKSRKKIEEEYSSWEAVQYSGKDKKERQKLGQFFTPPALSIKMLEKFDSVADKDILDPTVGAGGLLAAAILAGADPSRCYGIELDETTLKFARKRLARLGVPPGNLVLGDALDPKSYEEKIRPFTLKKYAIACKDDAGAFRLTVVSNGKYVHSIISDLAKARSALKILNENNIEVFTV